MVRTELVPRTVPIVGEPTSVANAIMTQAAAGRLLTHPDRIRWRERPDGKVEAAVTILVQVRRRDDSFQQVMKALAFAMLILAVSGGLVWAVVAAVGPRTILAAVVLFALFAVAIVFNRASHRGACPGVIVHCRGCKH